MTDLQKLIADAREVGAYLGPINGGTVLTNLADAVDALERERHMQVTLTVDLIKQRDALLAQLDNMTTEWWLGDDITGVLHGPYKQEPVGVHYYKKSRLVGPWVEVTDE